MNRNLALISAVIATAAMAQAPSAAIAQVAPRAVPAKIALIQLEQVAAATNEGQRSLQDLQKKYEPRVARVEALRKEIDTLTKQLQAAPASMSEAERASRVQSVSTKQKQFERDGQDLQSSVGADEQDVIGKVVQKLGPIVLKYVQKNGYTMLLDNSGNPGAVAVLWAQDGTDISEAIVNAYNASSGVAAPVKSSTPSTAPRPRPATPAGTTPKPPAK